YEFEKITIGDVNFYGVGYPGFAVDEVLEKLSENLNENEKNIVMVHTALGGSEFLPGLVNTDIIKRFKDKVIYMAGGHLHSFISYPKDKPYFFIPGSTEFWNVLNEKNNSKGVIIFDTDTLEYEFSELSPRTRIEKEFTYENDITDEFEEFSKNLGLTGEELVIVNIKLKDSGYVNVNELEKILESNGALKGYIKLRYPNSIFDRNLGEEGYYSVRDVEREIINYWEEFSDAEKITSYLQKFKEYQEENDREKDFFELFDTMLEEEIGNENK
ncbi:exonuclease SbcCD subunit D, partial [uncultured Fusobacterium sp.]